MARKEGDPVSHHDCIARWQGETSPRRICVGIGWPPTRDGCGSDVFGSPAGETRRIRPPRLTYGFLYYASVQFLNSIEFVSKFHIKHNVFNNLHQLYVGRRIAIGKESMSDRIQFQGIGPDSGALR